MATSVERARRDLVIANRILALEHVVDAYGHVSVRHPADPNRFILSRSLAPELVEDSDLVEFTLDGKPANGDVRPHYLERFIHGSIYKARPDVNVVVHAHAEATLPFGIAGVPLRPVFHLASGIGKTVPVWDIADRFGSSTNLLVTNTDQGSDLAAKLDNNSVVLMRGHGFTAVGTHIVTTINMAVNLPKNARVQLEAMRLGKVQALASGEIDQANAHNPELPSARRGWAYWAAKAGVGHLITE